MRQIPTIFYKLVLIGIALIGVPICVFILPAVFRDFNDEVSKLKEYRYLIFGAIYLSAFLIYFALFQAFKLLNYVDSKKAFSLDAVKAIRNIKYSAVLISAIYASFLILFYIWAEEADAPGLIFIGMIFPSAVAVVAVFVAIFERVLTEAIKIKSENDLTV